MSSASPPEWNGFGSFLRDIDVSKPDIEPTQQPDPPRAKAKYHLEEFEGSRHSLEDAIDVIGELRRFAKHGILITCD